MPLDNKKIYLLITVSVIVAAEPASARVSYFTHPGGCFGGFDCLNTCIPKFILHYLNLFIDGVLFTDNARYNFLLPSYNYFSDDSLCWFAFANPSKQFRTTATLNDHSINFGLVSVQWAYTFIHITVHSEQTTNPK